MSMVLYKIFVQTLCHYVHEEIIVQLLFYIVVNIIEVMKTSSHSQLS